MACIDLTLSSDSEDEAPARPAAAPGPARLSAAGGQPVAPSGREPAPAQPASPVAKPRRAGKLSIWDMLDSDVDIPPDLGTSKKAARASGGSQDQGGRPPPPPLPPARQGLQYNLPAQGGQDYDQDDWPGTNQGAKGRLPAAAAAAPAQQPAAAEPAPPPQLARASSGSGTQGLASTDLEVLKEAAEGYADEEADKARAQGLDAREVARIRKAAYQRNLKDLKEQAKQEAKLQKQAAREQAKAAKLEQKAAEKAAKQSEKELNRALSGGGSDPLKHMTLLVSPKLMNEADWLPTLLGTLRDHSIDYKIMDASQPLCQELAFIRFVRRVPRQAAALVSGSQSLQGNEYTGGGDAGEEASEALQPITIPDLNDPSVVPLAFPLIMLFVKPQQLIDALPHAHAVPGAPYKLTYAPQHAQHGRAPHAQQIGLSALQQRVSQHYPQCTLTVACVGLDKALTLKEREPHSTFNSAVIRNQLLDVQLARPAIRLREDLTDAGMVCDLVINTTRCLAQHHKKQQGDGYLDSHSQSSVSARHPGLTHATAGQRTLALALGHLVPPQRAVALAMQHTSVPALLRLLTNPALGPRQREEALMTHGAERGATVGKVSAKAVHDFFTQANPEAPCRREAAPK